MKPIVNNRNKNVITSNSRQQSIEIDRKTNCIPVVSKENFDSKKIKMREMWSSSEDDALQEGIQDFGHGQWTKILEKNRKKFKDRRTPSALKDRTIQYQKRK